MDTPVLNPNLSGCAILNTGHQQTDLLARCSRGVQCIDNAPLVHDGNAIRQRHDFVQFSRNQQNRHSPVALSNDLRVNELD